MSTTKPDSAMPNRQSVKSRAAARSSSTALVPIFGLFASLSALNRPALAQTATEKALQRAEAALAQEQALAPETKAALQELLGALRSERAKAPAASAAEPKAAPSASPSANRLKLSSDFRLRHESSFKLDDQPSRTRERLRFRVGGTYQVTDQVTFGARLATGSRTDANSPHVTLGDVFHKQEFNLDRAFLAYKPNGVPGLTATGGKFAHPFWTNPVYGDLVWDSDVQPEGAALTYSRKGTGAIEKWDLAIGEYLSLEQAQSDARSFVVQAAVHAKMGNHWKPSLAVGYYHHGNLTPDGAQAIVNENSGNATVGAGPNLAFASRFSIINPIAALRYEGGKHPIVLSAEYIKNLKAGIPQDQGWAIGAAIGAARKKGDWRTYYQWQKVEQDAVLSVLSQDDFLLQTNHRSHLLGANYQVRDNLGFHLWALASQRDRTTPGLTTDSSKLQWRLRFDTNVAF